MTTKKDLDERVDDDTKKKIEEVEKEDDGSGCPRRWRCCWNFQVGSEKFEGHSEWVCRCRAADWCRIGQERFGKDSHWLEEKQEKPS